MREVLETRTTPEGYIVRRRLRPDGTTWRTIEVPLQVWARINTPGRAQDRAAEATRALHRQILRDAAVERMLAGEKPLAVAHDIGVPERTLYRWRKKARS